MLARAETEIGKQRDRKLDRARAREELSVRTNIKLECARSTCTKAVTFELDHISGAMMLYRKLEKDQ